MKLRSPFFNTSRTNLLILIALILGAIAILYPLLVVLQASLTTADGHITLANFQQAWQQGGFLLAFANSTIVALSVTALQIVTSAMAGYALARLEFKGKQAILL
ncbi:MAG: carbohydrate ABC transporter permease, partial [Cyanobacteria bacterium J06631_6]